MSEQQIFFSPLQPWQDGRGLYTSWPWMQQSKLCFALSNQLVFCFLKRHFEFSFHFSLDKKKIMFGIPSRISGRLTISSLEGLRRETNFCRIVSDTSYSISSLINSMAKTYTMFYSIAKNLLLIYMWYWLIPNKMFNWQMINDPLRIQRNFCHTYR